MKRPLLIVAAFFAVLFSCTHDAVNPSSPVSSSTGNTSGNTTGTGTGSGSGTGSGTGTTNAICFQTDVLPLFQTYCASAGCHDAATAREELVLTSYANIMRGISANKPNSSKYYQVIADGSMPPRNSPKLSSAQITTIANWIKAGATNNTCVVATCDTTKTTYTNGVSQIFATYCNGCHGLAPGSGNVVLSDYASAKAAGVGMKINFLNAINYTSATPAMNMPQSGKLSDCQITQITKWINSGCPQ